MYYSFLDEIDKYIKEKGIPFKGERKKIGLNRAMEQEKTKETNVKKYGYENVFQVKEFQEKMHNTMEEKYNVKNALENEIFLQKHGLRQRGNLSVSFFLAQILHGIFATP